MNTILGKFEVNGGKWLYSGNARERPSSVCARVLHGRYSKPGFVVSLGGWLGGTWDVVPRRRWSVAWMSVSRTNALVRRDSGSRTKVWPSVHAHRMGFFCVISAIWVAILETAKPPGRLKLRTARGDSWGQAALDRGGPVVRVGVLAMPKDELAGTGALNVRPGNRLVGLEASGLEGLLGKAYLERARRRAAAM